MGASRDNWIKCKTDGAYRGNPDRSTYVYCVRDHRGDLIFAEAQKIGVTTIMEAEKLIVLWGLRYCIAKSIGNVIVKTDSLSLYKILLMSGKYHGN